MVTCPFQNVLWSPDLVTWLGLLSPYPVYVFYSVVCLEVFECLDVWETFSCSRFSQHGPPFKFPHPEEFFHRYQFSSHFFSLSLLYLLFPQPYSSFAVNSLGNSQLNSLSSSSCSCRLSSSSSSLYSLSNSSTSSFAFSRFFLLF